jgi:hypothetical protein
MNKLKVGDILIADGYCGIPDKTTQGKEYVVSKVYEVEGGRMFWIIDDNNQERFPISTSFKKKA